MLKPPTSDPQGLPDYPHHHSNVLCPIPRQTRQVRLSIASLSARPSPSKRRVGVCIDFFEACSNFTNVTARWIARPPKAAFVTRLRRGQLPSRAARQLPDQSKSLRMEPSSIDDARLRGALLPASYPDGSMQDLGVGRNEGAAAGWWSAVRWCAGLTPALERQRLSEARCRVEPDLPDITGFRQVLLPERDLRGALGHELRVQTQRGAKEPRVVGRLGCATTPLAWSSPTGCIRARFPRTREIAAA